MPDKFLKTIYSIPKMDCPSEEKMVRMALEDNKNIVSLKFNFQERSLLVVHNDTSDHILSSLAPLKYGAKIQEESEFWPDLEEMEESLDPVKEAKVLKQLLAINGFMFVFEIIFGIYARSMGLVSDSLDMLADATVYGLSLYAVGKSLSRKKYAAKFSGYLQIVLALAALSETVRRFYFGSDPEGLYMIGIAFIALLANVSCLLILFKHKEGGVHMKASWIFSTNDVIANMGVIAAGFFVYFLRSPYPDLVIGLIVAIIVLRGAMAILKIAK